MEVKKWNIILKFLKNSILHEYESEYWNRSATPLLPILSEWAMLPFFCFVKVKSSDCYGRIRIRTGGNGHLLGTSGNKPGQEGFPAFPQRTILHATLKVQLHPHFKNAWKLQRVKCKSQIF